MTEVAPWELQRIADLWDAHSRPLSFRCFTVGKAGSTPRACRRLAVILDRHHLSLEDLEARLLIALIYLQQQGLDKAKQITGSELNARLTFWRFIDPPDNLSALADAALNRTPEVVAQQQHWRQQKRQLLDAFKAEVNDFIEQAVYLSGSDLNKLEAALHAARTGLVNAEDVLSD